MHAFALAHMHVDTDKHTETHTVYTNTRRERIHHFCIVWPVVFIQEKRRSENNQLKSTARFKGENVFV